MSDDLTPEAVKSTTKIEINEALFDLGEAREALVAMKAKFERAQTEAWGLQLVQMGSRMSPIPEWLYPKPGSLAIQWDQWEDEPPLTLAVWGHALNNAEQREFAETALEQAQNIRYVLGIDKTVDAISPQRQWGAWLRASPANDCVRHIRSEVKADGEWRLYIFDEPGEGLLPITVFVVAVYDDASEEGA